MKDVELKISKVQERYWPRPRPGKYYIFEYHISRIPHRTHISMIRKQIINDNIEKDIR